MAGTKHDARAQLRQAERIQSQTRNAGRWFATVLLIAAAVAFAYIVALELVFPDGYERALAAVVPLVSFAGVALWARSKDVVPHGSTRRVYTAIAVWFTGYLVVVGPAVRGWWDDDPLAWVAGSAVLATPFLVAAWREARQR